MQIPPDASRDPARPAAPHLRREAAGRWKDPCRLQHSEGVYFASGPASPGRAKDHAYFEAELAAREVVSVLVGVHGNDDRKV